MDAKALGFKFQPGDKVELLGQEGETRTVTSCVLILGGESQAVRRQYELAPAKYGERGGIAVLEEIVKAPRP